MENLMRLDTGLMFWTWITFLAVLVILGTKAWKPMVNALEKRERFIKDSMAQANEARLGAEKVAQDYENMVSRARHEAREIVTTGKQTAEKVKIAISSATITRDKKEYRIRGRDSSTGLPKDVVINSNEITEAIHPHLADIMSYVHEVFNDTPPELVADIMEKGIILSGGGAQIANLPLFIKQIIGVNAYVAEDPLFCVARGTGLILNHIDIYKRTLLTKH